ncbi:unnamed protein product, partial [marine sediment metagenome]
SHTLASHSTKAHTELTGVTSDLHHPQSHNAVSHSDITSTGAQIDDAVSKKHTRSHSITSASDHTSTATPYQILKADANGLPIDATNTDGQVSAAVTASHAKQHALSSAADHTGTITLTQHGDLSGDALTKHKWTQISNKPATFTPSAHGLVSASHTAAGLTIGHVVRATGAGAFAWAQLQHSDLGGVTANQHHAQTHTLASHSTKAHTELTNVTTSQHHVKTVSGDINHNATVNTHNLTTDIDHDTITNTHNLTTDIDHGS